MGGRSGLQAEKELQRDGSKRKMTLERYWHRDYTEGTLRMWMDTITFHIFVLRFTFFFFFCNLEHTWSHPSTLWPALYLLCLHPVLWLSLSAHACAMHTYLHLCMPKLLWIMEWCGFTLVCCESSLLPILLFIFNTKRIFMHDVFWCTKPFVWEKWYLPPNNPYTVM